MTPGPAGRPRPGGDEPPAEQCAVPGCGGEVARHLALTEARKVFNTLPERGRRAPLCRDHYKQWKKATKADRQLDRLTWS